MEKTSEGDMQRLYDYMDKMRINYTINRNPSPEQIERIKAVAYRKRTAFHRGGQVGSNPIHGTKILVTTACSVMWL